jgi:hypothetical protein
MKFHFLVTLDVPGAGSEDFQEPVDATGHGMAHSMEIRLKPLMIARDQNWAARFLMAGNTSPGIERVLAEPERGKLGRLLRWFRP